MQTNKQTNKTLEWDHVAVHTYMRSTRRKRKEKKRVKETGKKNTKKRNRKKQVNKLLFKWKLRGGNRKVSERAGGRSKKGLGEDTSWELLVLICGDYLKMRSKMHLLCENKMSVRVTESPKERERERERQRERERERERERQTDRQRQRERVCERYKKYRETGQRGVYTDRQTGRQIDR